MKHISPTTGEADTLTYDDPRHGGTEAEIRQRVYPEPLILIPGLLTSGLTVLAAGPKTGKSVLAQQIEHYLGAGIPFKGWPEPQTRHRVLVIDLEGNAEATQDTSLRLAPDAEDDRFSGIEYVYPADLPARSGPMLLLWLTEQLAAAKAAGDPYTYVRIDTMRLFHGAAGSKVNAYDWDAQANAELNQLGLAYGCAILALHHLTKASEESGDWLERLSGSMGVSGSATSIWLVERARGASTGVWRTTSRRLQEAEHALEWIGGAWSFSDRLTVDQASHTGTPRVVIDHLTKHPTARWSDLRELGKPGNVRKALTRLTHQRVVQCIEGMWSLTKIPDNPAAQPEPTRPPATGWPEGSIGAEMNRGVLQTVPAPRLPLPAELPPHPDRPMHPAAPEPELDPDPERVKSALGTLKDTIGTVTSRPCKPIPLVRVDDRTGTPWTLAVQASDNRHRWRHPDIDAMGDHEVVVIDRNGSYPSAMSNVPVAPNMLLHTGPVDPSDTKRAGLFLIEVPEHGADAGGRMGHVLGSRAEGAETMWVTAPSIRAMRALGIPVRVLDSWTGKSVANLFEPYNRWCKMGRARLMSERPEPGTDAFERWEAEYGEFKRQTSIAIRMIWPKSRESGLWRPDWHQAVLAEANIRHWMKAHRSGAELLAMLDCDEAAFAVPDGAPPEWLPDGYRLGPEFGAVKIKFRGTVSEWQASKRRARRGDR